MSDFELSQALEGLPDLDRTGFESCCFNMTDVEEKVYRLDEGLDMVVSHNPKTLKSVANLLLMATRMKKSLTDRGRQLREDELCSAIMESLVIETVIKTTERSAAGMKRIFQRVSSESLWSLCDSSHKDIIRNSGELKLEAATLKGGNYERKVNFKVSRYITACIAPGDGQSVLLSLTNTLHISCSMKDGKAVLSLEECSGQKLKNISDDENMDRFLFFRTTSSFNLNTFESVLCRGWFISTSYEGENQPVEMCKVDAINRLTCFNLNE